MATGKIGREAIVKGTSWDLIAFEPASLALYAFIGRRNSGNRSVGRSGGTTPMQLHASCLKGSSVLPSGRSAQILVAPSSGQSKVRSAATAKSDWQRMALQNGRLRFY